MAYTFEEALSDLWMIQLIDLDYKRAHEAMDEIQEMMRNLEIERQRACTWSAAWKRKAKELRAYLGLVGRIRELTNEPLIEADSLDDDDLFDDADDPYSGMEEV